jgi:hypothetical protein
MAGVPSMEVAAVVGAILKEAPVLEETVAHGVHTQPVGVERVKVVQMEPQAPLTRSGWVMEAVGVVRLMLVELEGSPVVAAEGEAIPTEARAERAEPGLRVRYGYGRGDKSGRPVERWLRRERLCSR